MNSFQSPPAVPTVARVFNRMSAALVFVLMLAFAGWVVVHEFDGGRASLVRVCGGALIGAGALTLLAAVRREHLSGTPFQHSRTVHVGMALFGIGTTALLAG